MLCETVVVTCVSYVTAVVGSMCVACVQSGTEVWLARRALCGVNFILTGASPAFMWVRCTYLNDRVFVRVGVCAV